MNAVMLLTIAAVNADPKVVGCALVQAGGVLRADGLRVRIDTVDGSPAAPAAVTAVVTLDLTAAQESLNQTQAASLFGDSMPASRGLRAVLLVVMDELNVLRARCRAQDAAIAAATSLTNLQTRWAALVAMPDRTAAQIKPAVSAKIASADSD